MHCLIPETVLALKGSYLVSSELPLCCASDGCCGPVVVVVVAWLPMASYGFLWRRRLASYGFLWRRRLASYGRRRLGFLWSPPRLPMVAALASYGLRALASYGLLALLACIACLQCLLAMLPCTACLHCLLA